MKAHGAASVGAYEAKTRFSDLLRRVEAGEELTITRHGAPVARMVPIKGEHSRRERRAATLAMRKLAKGNTLRGLKIKDLIAEGRR